MVEMGTFFVAAIATGSAIALGVGFGTRYINQKLRFTDITASGDRPLVRPSRLSGMDWDSKTP